MDLGNIWLRVENAVISFWDEEVRDSKRFIEKTLEERNFAVTAFKLSQRIKLDVKEMMDIIKKIITTDLSEVVQILDAFEQDVGFAFSNEGALRRRALYSPAPRDASKAKSIIKEYKGLHAQLKEEIKSLPISSLQDRLNGAYRELQKAKNEAIKVEIEMEKVKGLLIKDIKLSRHALQRYELILKRTKIENKMIGETLDLARTLETMIYKIAKIGNDTLYRRDFIGLENSIRKSARSPFLLHMVHRPRKPFQVSEIEVMRQDEIITRSASLNEHLDAAAHDYGEILELFLEMTEQIDLDINALLKLKDKNDELKLELVKEIKKMSN